MTVTVVIAAVIQYFSVKFYTHYHVYIDLSILWGNANHLMHENERET